MPCNMHGMVNIKMDLGEVWWEGVNWMHVAQSRDQWWAVVNKVMKGEEFLDQLSDC